MGDIDYSSSDILEYELTFDYENFVPYSVTNFTLTDADVQRFEQGYKFVGPAFEEGRKPIVIGTKESPATKTPTNLDFLGAPASAGGTGGRSQDRTGQPTIKKPESPTATQPAAPGQSTTTAAQPSPAQAATAATSDAGAAANASQSGGTFKGDTRAKLTDVYGDSARFAAALGKTKKSSFLENLVGNAAGAALGAALSGKNVKNAVVGSVVGTSVSAVSSNLANNRSRPVKTRGIPPPAKGETEQKNPT